MYLSARIRFNSFFVIICMMQCLYGLHGQIPFHYYTMEPRPSELNLLSWVYVQGDLTPQNAQLVTLATGYQSGELMQLVRNVSDLEVVGHVQINAEVLPASSFSWNASMHAFADRNILVIRRLCHDGWKEVVRLSDHLSAIKTTSFSSDGTRIISGDADGVIKVWHSQNETWKQEISFFIGCQGAHSVAFLGETRIIAIQENGIVSVWNFGQCGSFSLEGFFQAEKVAIAYCQINHLFAFGYDDGFGIECKVDGSNYNLSIPQVFRMMQGVRSTVLHKT